MQISRGSLADRIRQGGEEGAGGIVDPMRILHDEDGRLDQPDLEHPDDRIVHLGNTEVGVEGGDFRRLGQIEAEDDADQRNPRRELGGPLVHESSQPVGNDRGVGVHGDAQDRAQQEVEHVVGRVRFILLADQQKRIEVGGASHHLLGEAGLADTGLTADLNDRTLLLTDLVHDVEDPGQLVVTADEAVSLSAAPCGHPDDVPDRKGRHRLGLAFERQGVEPIGGKQRPGPVEHLGGGQQLTRLRRRSQQRGQVHRVTDDGIGPAPRRSEVGGKYPAASRPGANDKAGMVVVCDRSQRSQQLLFVVIGAFGDTGGEDQSAPVDTDVAAEDADHVLGRRLLDPGHEILERARYGGRSTGVEQASNPPELDEPDRGRAMLTLTRGRADLGAKRRRNELGEVPVVGRWGRSRGVAHLGGAFQREVSVALREMVPGNPISGGTVQQDLAGRGPVL